MYLSHFKQILVGRICNARIYLVSLIILVTFKDLWYAKPRIFKGNDIKPLATLINFSLNFVKQSERERKEIDETKIAI